MGEQDLTKSFAFVMNVASLEVSECDLGDGRILRRASNTEVEVIRDTLKRLNVGNSPMGPAYYWEHKLPGKGGGQWTSLPQSEWRYIVISFIGTNECIHKLTLASDLAKLELEIGWTSIVTPGRGAIGLAFTPQRISQVISPLQEDSFCYIKLSDLNEIKVIEEQLESASVELRNIANQVGSLKVIPHYSPLLFLGYFAILESLLTHAPNPTDPYDSITRQIKKKLALLDHRFPTGLDYSPFLSTGAEKIWTKMYKYRSALAHGGTPDFDDELNLLKVPGVALTLIKDAVKAVVRQAFIEPQLLADLRDC